MLSRILHMTNAISAMPGSASMISRPKQPITMIFSSSMSLLSGEKEGSPLDRHGGGFLLIGGACYHDSEVFTQAHPIILPLVVDLLAREDHVRVGNTVLVGKANVVTAPTDLLRDAGQRVTGLDDIAAVTGGLHA